MSDDARRVTQPQTKGNIKREVCSCASLLSRSAHDQPVVEVLKNQNILATEKGHDRLHHASKDCQQGGEAEQQSSELKEYSVEAEAEEMRVLRMN